MENTLLKEALKGVAFFLIAIAIFAGGAFVAIKAQGQQDAGDCHKWAEQAQQFPGYYITHWQKAQCDYWKVKINAPVK